MNLDGRKVLLTGASGGLGNAIARSLAKQGAHLVLTARRVEIIEKLASEIDGTAIAIDLSERDQVDSLIAQSLDVDVLVANAALPASGSILGYSEAELDRALEVNLRAPIALAHGLLPGMIERRNGSVVFMNSISGKAATVGSALYSATKYGLRGFAQSLRADLHGTGVTVSSIYPGPISDAGMYADAGAEFPSYLKSRSPQQVADAVIKAVETGKANQDVASFPVAAGGIFGLLVPGAFERLNRIAKADKIAEKLSAGQLDKR